MNSVEWEADNISFELNEYDDEAWDTEILSRPKKPSSTASTFAAVFAADDAAIEENERRIRQLEAEFDRDAADDELPVVALCHAVQSVVPAGGALGGAGGRGRMMPPGVMRVAEGERLSVLQRDLGSGWTYLRNGQGATGFVPTSALSIVERR